MIQGTVEWFDADGGRGCIRTDEGESLFVHRRDVEADSRTLASGQRVRLDRLETSAGPRAAHVHPVQGGPKG